jgi:hypothetical protein
VGTEQMKIPETMTEAEWEAIQEDVYYPMVMEALEASGACWVRVGVRWKKIQPDPSEPYNWSYHDNMLGQIAETGAQMVATVGGLPDWAASSTHGPIYDHRLDEFAEFVTNLVNRYKQPPYNIQAWELTNEPDWTSSDPAVGWGYNGDQYAEMLAVAYPAIKAADPQATVLMGGIAYDWFTEYLGPFYRYFPDEVIESGGDGYFDALNFHYFPDFYMEWERWVPDGDPPTCGFVEDGEGTPYDAWGIDVIAKTNHLRNRMATCHGVDRPVWLTEFSEHGYPNDPDSLAQQARYVFQGYARALAVGIEKAFWMTLVPSLTSGDNHGLIYVYPDHWSPTPAFYTYQTLTSELVDYEYVYTLQVGSVEGYVFRNSEQREKTVAWSWGQPHESGFLTFAPASQLRVVDRHGNATFVQDGGPQDADGIENGSVTFELPPVPVDPDPGDNMRITAEPLIVSIWQ